MPALVTVSSEAGDLRLATLKAIQDTRKKPVTVWKASDLDVDPSRPRARDIVLLRHPSTVKRCRVLIEGASAYEKGKNLALRLREDNVI